MKLLDYLLGHELAPDDRTARGLIMRGDVLVDDLPQTSEHFTVTAEATVRLRNIPPAVVSRGELKLRPVIKRTGFDVAGRICLDLGVATGGFTKVLLDGDAARVYAVDVAYGTAAMSIRNDPRVVLLERTNARQLTRERVPEAPERVVGDLSFISWAAVLPAVVPLLAPAAELLLLIKPQFELSAQGRGSELAAGIVVDRSLVLECLSGLYNTWHDNGLAPRLLAPAGIRGAKGNQEYFAWLAREGNMVSRADYLTLAAQAVAEVE